MGKVFHNFLLASPWGALRELWGSSVGYAGSGEPSASTATCPALSPHCRHRSCGPAWHLCVMACEQRADLVILINTVSAMALAGCDLCGPKTQGGKLVNTQESPPQKVGKGRVVLPTATLLPLGFQSQGQAPARPTEIRTPQGWRRLGLELYSAQIP